MGTGTGTTNEQLRICTMKIRKWMIGTTEYFLFGALYSLGTYWGFNPPRQVITLGDFLLLFFCWPFFAVVGVYHWLFG